MTDELVRLSKDNDTFLMVFTLPNLLWVNNGMLKVPSPQVQVQSTHEVSLIVVRL